MIKLLTGNRPRVVHAGAALLALFLASVAAANPQNIAPGSKLVFGFNVIGKPADQSFAGGCGGGRRIFVNRDANSAHINVTNGNFWAVLDCDATSDHTAVLQSSQVGIYDIYTRILGKPGGHLHICGDLTIDPVTGDTLCLAGTLDLTRAKGQSKFQIAPSSLFDASLADVLWTVDTNPDFRIAQFRVYSRP